MTAGQQQHQQQHHQQQPRHSMPRPSNSKGSDMEHPEGRYSAHNDNDQQQWHQQRHQQQQQQRTMRHPKHPSPNQSPRSVLLQKSLLYETAGAAAAAAHNTGVYRSPPGRGPRMHRPVPSPLPPLPPPPTTESTTFIPFFWEFVEDIFGISFPSEHGNNSSSSNGSSNGSHNSHNSSDNNNNNDSENSSSSLHRNQTRKSSRVGSRSTTASRGGTQGVSLVAGMSRRMGLYRRLPTTVWVVVIPLALVYYVFHALNAVSLATVASGNSLKLQTAGDEPQRYHQHQQHYQYQNQRQDRNGGAAGSTGGSPGGASAAMDLSHMTPEERQWFVVGDTDSDDEPGTPSEDDMGYEEDPTMGDGDDEDEEMDDEPPIRPSAPVKKSALSARSGSRHARLAHPRKRLAPRVRPEGNRYNPISIPDPPFNYSQPAQRTSFTLPDAKPFPNETVVVFVMSARANFDRRNAIRETWGKGHAVYFILGGPAFLKESDYRDEITGQKPAAAAAAVKQNDSAVTIITTTSTNTNKSELIDFGNETAVTSFSLMTNVTATPLTTTERKGRKKRTKTETTAQNGTASALRKHAARSNKTDAQAQPARGVASASLDEDEVQSSTAQHLRHRRLMSKHSQDFIKEREWIVHKHLKAEQRNYGDLIDSIHPDTYKSLPYKLKFAYHWILEHNPGVQWLVKVDDDTVVRVATLEKVLGLYNPSLPIVMGRIIVNSPVHKSGKWAEYDYPGKKYPYWPQGSCGHIVSRPVAKYVADTKGLFYYQGEDTSLGIWLDDADRVHNASLHVTWLSSGYFANHGACHDKHLIIIGHQIGVDRMRECFEETGDEWNDTEHHEGAKRLTFMETRHQQIQRQKEEFLKWKKYDRSSKY